MKDYYKELEQIMERIAIISSASSILYWDTAVMMPPGASEHRGKQLAELGVITHEMFTSEHVGFLISQAKTQDLDIWQSANLREISKS